MPWQRHMRRRQHVGMTTSVLAMSSLAHRTGYWESAYLKSVFGILIGTGLLKLVSVFKGYGTAGQFYLMLDPLSGVPYNYVAVLVGFLEVFTALLCIVPNKAHLAIALTAWLATNYLLYHIGLWLTGWQLPCGCLGYLTVALHLSPVKAAEISLLLTVYMAVGSSFLLLRPAGGGSLVGTR